MSRTALHSGRSRSPQAVDPLSWYTGPLIPLAFATLVVVYGVILSLTTAAHSSSVAMQLVATALCASACVLIHFATRPKQPPMGWLLSAAAVLIALCGCQLSAQGYAGGGLPVEQWWAPGVISLTVVSLAPYLSVRRLLVLGLVATVGVGVIGIGLFSHGSDPWSLPGTAALLVTAPLTGVTAASVFIVTVVQTMERLLAERAAGGDADGRVDQEAGTSIAESAALARLTARVTPFLKQLAATGHVTATDRAVAGQLARRLRDDLVSRVDASWLDTIAAGRPVIVMDPEHRADAMNDAQKSALTGLIDAILDTPDIVAKSLLIELRGEDSGATAVAVSMDLHLSEGRRTTHLAPYYLTLKTAFEGLSWSDGRLLSMRFEAPPHESGE
jgi:hypothetical protein